jgi:RNA polymerase sigma-70 factor (ECF subfamily)
LSRASGRGDEAELVRSLRRGDAAAYEFLVRSYAGRLLSVTRRLLGDEDEARDAVQEAFLSAFKSIEGFQGESRLSTWLHRIAVNHALMRLRSRRRRPEEKIEDLLPRYQDDGHMLHPAEPWPELSDERLAREETRARVRDAIARLPEGYRTVLVLRDIEELDTAEVAAQLGMTTNAVKTRLHRARQALRELLDRDLREEPS